MALLAVVTLGAGENTSQKALVPQTSAVDTPEAHLGKAYDSLKQDRYDEAASEFRAALKLDPTLTLRARFPLAVALFEMKKFDEAETGPDVDSAGALSFGSRAVRDEEIR